MFSFHNIKTRMAAVYFMQFAVWGCYLSCFGQLLGAGGLGDRIQWFYAALGLVSLVTPPAAGHVADRFVAPARLLGLCHLAAALAMCAAWLYSTSHARLEFLPFFTLYVCFLAFYMPTMALSATTAFTLLKSEGLNPVSSFPTIRVWGTVGFVAAMWFVNSAYIYDGHFGIIFSDMSPASRLRFQYTPMQLLCSSMAGIVTALLTLTLPAIRPQKKTHNPTVATERRSPFTSPAIRNFLLLIIFSGVCLQISNGYVVPFINHFMGVAQYAGNAVAANATGLFSLSQISEALCLVIVGIFIRRWGYKAVMVTAMCAWCLRFLCLACGNPGSGLWLLILSMLSYGVAFSFLNIAGPLYMEHLADSSRKGVAQGLIMTMSNGIGATVGMLGAGEVINRYCHWQPVSLTGNVTMPLFMGDWTAPWLIFAAYAAVVAALFALFLQGKNLF